MAASSKSTATVRGQKGSQNQAIGKSKGCMTIKILALVDALGNLVGFRLLPGQRHDICGVEPLIRDRKFGALLADKSFDADWLVKNLTERDRKMVIPQRNRKAPREYDKEMYKWRHLVENFFCNIERVQEGCHAGGKNGFILFRQYYLSRCHSSSYNKVNRPKCLQTILSVDTKSAKNYK